MTDETSDTDVRELQTAGSLSADDARILGFLVPGLAHALGNHLFAIRGSASVLARGKDSVRPRQILDSAVEEAEHVLAILRVFAEARAEPRPEQAGVLLGRLCRLFRVPLRDRGLDVDVSHSSLQTPRCVPTGAFVRAVAELVRCTVEGLPTFVAGSLHIDLAEQSAGDVVVALRVEHGQPMLPFSLELPEIARRAARVVERVGGRIDVQDRESLRLHLHAD